MNKEGEIIIIDDDQDDRDFLYDVFESLKLPNKVVFFEDSTQVISYLTCKETNPFIIISDINMPKMDGFELRALVIQNEELSKKCIPFIFLTTSDSPQHVEKAFKLSANGYFKKEVTFSGYQSMIGDIIAYWKRCRKPLIG